MEEKHGIHFTEELMTAPGFGPLTREVMDTVQSVLDMNDPVGIAAGYYTDGLPIVCATRFFAEMLGYERERLGREPGLKLEDIICTTPRYPFEKRDFSALWGKFRVYMLTQKGAAVLMTCFKEETRDAQGRPMWVISARPSRTEQYLTLVEDIREISQWYIDYDRSGQVTQVHWDDNLRALLADPPGTPLPGSKGLGERIHPEDRPRIRKELAAFFFDPGRDSFTAECRLLLGSRGQQVGAAQLPGHPPHRRHRQPHGGSVYEHRPVEKDPDQLRAAAAVPRYLQRRQSLRVRGGYGNRQLRIGEDSIPPFRSLWKAAPIGMLWPGPSAKNTCCRSTGIRCCSAAAGIISAEL